MKDASGSVERHAPSRMEQYEKAGRMPPLPEIPEGGDYLINALWALRPTRPMPMGGVRPADWPEILPFMQTTGAISEAWEAEALHRMCEAYCAGLHAGKSPLGKEPMGR